MKSSTVAVFALAAAVVAQNQPTPTITDDAGLTSVISGKFSAWTYCSNLLATCQPTASSCASSLCAGCTTIGQSLINSCCAAETGVVACFSSARAQAIASPSPSPTDPPPQNSLTAPGYQACSNMSSYLSGCASLTPGFATLTAFAFQAPCLCYDSHKQWAPATYDGWVSTCASWMGLLTRSLEPATPVITAPCSSVGDVMSHYSAWKSTASAATESTTTKSLTPSATVTSQATRTRNVFHPSGEVLGLGMLTILIGMVYTT